ncbi:hypothetical protein Dimus_015880, partial [Dionaea muscipula]
RTVARERGQPHMEASTAAGRDSAQRITAIGMAASSSSRTATGSLPRRVFGERRAVDCSERQGPGLCARGVAAPSAVTIFIFARTAMGDEAAAATR